MQVSIRDSRRGDFEELWRIDQLCFQTGIAYSKQELGYYMAAKNAFTLVAEVTQKDGGFKTVGFLVGQKYARGMGHIITIDVLPEARRAQVGSQLMEVAEAKLKAGGCASIFLEAAVNNQAALKFYKKRGYFVLKTIPRYYNDELDAFLLGKDLN